MLDRGGASIAPVYVPASRKRHVRVPGGCLASKGSSLADELFDLIARLPWWAGVALAAVSLVRFHAIAAQTIPPPIGVAQAGTFAAKTIVKAVSDLLQWIVPALYLAAAGASALHARRRKELAAGVAAAPAVDALNGMTWQQIERLVGEAFRLQDYSVVETGGGAPTAASI